MIIKRTIKFSIQNQRRAGSRLRMRVSYDGNRLDFQTGIVINKEDWNDKQQRIMRTNTTVAIANDLNAELSQMMVDMGVVFREFELRNIMPSTSQLRDAYKKQSAPQAHSEVATSEKDRTITVQQVDNKEEKPKNKSFWKCFDEFVKVNGKLNDWTPATHEKFAALRNHLTGFDKRLTFEKFDEEGISNFIDYLGKNGMKNSTINKQLGFLRWFLRWCYEKGYHANRTFEYYKPKLKNAAKRVVFLTAEELNTIETMKIPAKQVALGPVRDIFLFTCYTGLRYSDACNLS